MGIVLIPFTLAFTAGLLAVQLLPALPPAPVLCALALPALLPWRGRRLWSGAALGLLLAVLHGRLLLAERWPAERHGADVVASGWIASLPEADGVAQRFVFEPMPGAHGLPPRLRAAWYRGGEVVRGAECWRFTLRVRTPHGSLNPGAFDYEGWLLRQRIGATATVRDAARCDARGSLVLAARQRLSGRLREALPDRTSTALLAALTLGDRSGIPAADWDLFRQTGTTHLVAISGFNIAIVAGVAFFACRWLWALWPSLCLRLPAPRAGLAGAALFAGSYALLAGAEPPVQRAVLMLWLALVAAACHRLSRPSRVLALAWLLVLVVDPLGIASPGLWLSFGAVAAIFYVGLGRLRPPGPWHGLVLLQLLIALALAPLSLWFFQGSSWIGPLVNLVAVPFFAVLTPFALAALVAHLLWPAAGLPLLQLSATALELFRDALGACAQLPGLWVAASPSAAALAIAAVGVALLFAPRGLPLRALGVLCLAPLLATVRAPLRGDFELAALDVGQGLAVVVRTARHALLYDAGPAFEEGFDAGAAVVAPFLLRLGVGEVDVLMLSHGDNDHAGGVGAVRARLRVRREVGTASGEPCRAGQRWEWDGVRFEVLHPAAGGEGNDASCVLRVEGAYTALLPGDIEAAAEGALVATQGAALRADVLLAPHHGSRTSSSPAFVDAVRPRVVIHAAAWRHHFRHPRPEVVGRYAALGAWQAVTGQGGAVTVWRDPATGAIEVREHRREASRWWNAAAGP